jgi:hypothetical protein
VIPGKNCTLATGLAREQEPVFQSEAFFGREGNPYTVTSVDIVSFFGFIALVIIGIAIILLVVRLVWMLIPAAIGAAIVFLLTFNLWYAGLAFLAIAFLTVLFKILR